MILAKEKFLILLLSILCLAIFTYPASPVLFEIFIFNNKMAYVSYLVLGFVSIHFFSVTKTSRKVFLISKYYQSAYFSLIALLPIAFFVTNNQFLIREFLTLIFLYLIFHRLKGLNFFLLGRGIVYCYCLIILISELASLTYFLGPDHLNLYYVTNLELNHTNPILSREKSGDFVYSLLYYVAVIPYEPQSTFIRLPLIFTEPSYCAAYTSGILALVFLDKKLQFRRWIFLILISALLYSRSTLLIVLVLIGIIIALALIKRLYKSICVVFLGCLIFRDSLFKYLLETLPNNKFEEYLFYRRYGAFFSDHDKFSLWGSNETKPGILSYGIEDLFVSHGVLVASIYCLCLLLLISKSFTYLSKISLNLFERITTFISLFITCLFAIKFTYINILFPTFIFLYLKHLQTKSSHHFNQSQKLHNSGI